jgi:hypothetical protein
MLLSVYLHINVPDGIPCEIVCHWSWTRWLTKLNNAKYVLSRRIISRRTQHTWTSQFMFVAFLSEAPSFCPRIPFIVFLYVICGVTRQCIVIPNCVAGQPCSRFRVNHLCSDVSVIADRQLLEGNRWRWQQTGNEINQYARDEQVRGAVR